MIVVRVELHSAITHKISEIARMHICNKGLDPDPKLGDYSVETFRGRDKEALDKRTTLHFGEVVRHRRLDLHVWFLVAKALASVGYK